jgi:hypothetical protein
MGKGGQVLTRCQGLLRGRRPWPRLGSPRSGGRHRGALPAPRSAFPTVAHHLDGGRRPCRTVAGGELLHLRDLSLDMAPPCR